MAGVKAIEDLIGDAMLVLGRAQKAGPSAWTISGNVFTIHDQALADQIRRVLEGANRNQIELKKEVDNLRPLEVLGLARRSIAALQEVFGR